MDRSAVRDVLPAAAFAAEADAVGNVAVMVENPGPVAVPTMDCCWAAVTVGALLRTRPRTRQRILKRAWPALRQGCRLAADDWVFHVKLHR